MYEGPNSSTAPKAPTYSCHQGQAWTSACNSPLVLFVKGPSFFTWIFCGWRGPVTGRSAEQSG
eukprot:1139214-Pelagomonas_calceolata.AAC.1